MADRPKTPDGEIIKDNKSKGETEAMVDDVARDLAVATKMIPELQRALDAQKKRTAELEREKKDVERTCYDKIDQQNKMLEAKDKATAAEGEKAKKAIDALAEQLAKTEKERDAATAEARRVQGELDEANSWRSAFNEKTVGFMTAMMGFKMLTGCSPTTARGDADPAAFENIRKNIESNKIPDLQKAARELGDLKAMLLQAGFLADAKADMPAEQVYALKMLVTDAIAVQAVAAKLGLTETHNGKEVGSLSDAGKTAAQVPTLTDDVKAKQARIDELTPFVDSTHKLERETENQKKEAASLQAKIDMLESENGSKDKRISVQDDENATLRKNITSVEKELAEIQKSARVMDKTLAEFKSKAQAIVQDASLFADAPAAKSASPLPGALPPVAGAAKTMPVDGVGPPSPPAGGRVDSKSMGSTLKKTGKVKGPGVSALRSA